MADSRKSGAGRRAKRGGGAAQPDQGQPTGTGAVLGVAMVRYSSIQFAGRLVAVALGFATTIVIVNFVGPSEFGRLALLLFLAQLLAFVFGFPSRPGTIRRVFGAGADDEDDPGDADDSEEPTSESPERSLATGLLLTAVVACVGGAITVALAPEIGSLLGAGEDRTQIAWAALAGGFLAVGRLATAIVWLERRPVLATTLATTQPVLITAGVVPLVATGGGVEGAIAGTALGSGVAMAVAVFALRRSYELCLDPPEALAIAKRGLSRGPILASHWIVRYSNIFILSRFVTNAQLGIFMFASRAGTMFAFVPAGYRTSRRPLAKTTTFAAVEDEYGQAVTRGIQLAYFLILLSGTLLAAYVFADAIVRLAPDVYGNAASLVTLLAASLAADTVFRMCTTSAKFANKRRLFIGTLLAAGPVFIAISLVTVPALGLEGIPVALLITFVGPSLYVLYRSQHGERPIAVPWRSVLLAGGLAVACGLAYRLVDPDGLALELGLATALMAGWAALLLVTGAVPREHRRSLVRIGRTLAGRAEPGFRPRRALRRARPRDRAIMHAAVVEGATLEQLGRSFDGDESLAALRLVRALRRAAREGGGAVGERSDHDEEIGRYLLAPGSVAARDAKRRRLLSGDATARDVHGLEVVVAALAGAPAELWSRPPEGGSKDGRVRRRSRARRASRP